MWRILRREGIYLQRVRSWCVSTDPEFARKAAEIVGLYLDPPMTALVLSVDEKPSLHRGCDLPQSLEVALRKFTLSELSPRAVIHWVDDYPFRFVLNAKDDPMGKVDEMTNLEGEFTILWNNRTTLR